MASAASIDPASLPTAATGSHHDKVKDILDVVLITEIRFSRLTPEKTSLTSFADVFETISA